MFYIINTRNGQIDRKYKHRKAAINRWYELGGRAEGWRIRDEHGNPVLERPEDKPKTPKVRWDLIED